MRRRVGKGTTFLAAAAACVLAWQKLVHSDEALGPARVTKARISAFAYEPLRGNGGVAAAPPYIRERVYDKLQEQMQLAQTPEVFHRLALLHLLNGRAGAAEEYLVRAASRDHADPSVWGDLAAVELESGKVFDAVEHAARALEIDAANPTAAFNFALGLETLQVRPLAEEAWSRYLDLDRTSEWAGEARAHLARLRGPRPNWTRDGTLLVPGATPETIDVIVERYPQRSRAKALKELLPAYVVAGDPAALAMLRRIAMMRASAGDFFLQDAVEHTVAHRKELSRGFRAFAAGVAADAAVKMEEAALAFHEAVPELRRTGSPVALAAALYAARSDNYNGASEAALAQLDTARAEYAGVLQRYPSMAAELEWFRGLVHLRRGKPRECLAAYHAALAHARRCREIEHEAAILALIATQLDTVADPAEAERFRIDALRALDAVNAESRRVYTAYLESGTGALRSGRPRVALAFLEAASRIGRAERNAMYLADCEAWRALALVALERYGDASHAIESARRYAPGITTAGFRERTLANIAFITGRIHERGEPARAVAAYGEAIDLWDRKDWRMHLASAYLARGETYRRTGDRDAAERDYRAAISEMEDQRQNLAEPELRVSYFERADRAFVRLIELLLYDGRNEEALSIAERKRARVLLDHVASAGTAVPLDARAIAARTAGRAALLHVVLLDDRVQLWLTREGATVHARAEARREDVERIAGEHVEAIGRDDLASVTRSGRWLFDRLIAPVAHALPREADLVVVPDGALETFPFATLVTRDGAFLMERHAIAMTPSASVFLRQARRGGGGGVVVVAQPAPAGFDALPAGYAEASAVARGYGGLARLFRGEECPAQRFLEEVSVASVAHFVGHARADLRRPSQSALVFESHEAADGLTAETIGRARFRADPLVVLAACGTGRGRIRRNEGVSSLAAAFLQAGARGVVATLWDVEDGPASHLFRGFHRRLGEGRRPADALRDAQRALLHSTNPEHRKPSAWASAVVIGTL